MADTNLKTDRRINQMLRQTGMKVPTRAHAKKTIIPVAEDVRVEIELDSNGRLDLSIIDGVAHESGLVTLDKRTARRVGRAILAWVERM